MTITWDAENCLGLNKDVSPRKLPPHVWTDALNVQFRDGRTKKRDGQAEALFTFTSALADPSPTNTGADTITGISTFQDTVAEVWTITCTDATEPATFSVSGSVTGALDDATAGVAYTSPQIGFTIGYGASPAFVVGDNFTITLTKVAPADDIYHMIPWSTSTGYNWFWASLTDIYLWNGSTHTEVTRDDGASPPVTVDYTADADEQWTSCVLGEVVFMNNPNDLPQYYDSSYGAFKNMPNTGGAGTWPANLRCKALRAYKQYLVALNLSEGATLEPQNIRWSDSADPGSVPTWDITDATTDAGENTLSETDGDVVDGLTLGDTFIIYKQDSVWGMQLVGGQFVMRFYKIFGDRGLLTQNCVADVNGAHFCVGEDDVYMHNGSQPRSVVSNKIRRTLFQQIDDDYIDRCYVTADYRNREALFCYVLAGSGATVPNRAMVYNWESDECTFRDLPGSAHIGFGQLDDDLTPDSWDEDAETWESDNSEWGTVAGKPTQNRLLIPDTTGQTFYAEGRTNQDGGSNYLAFCEKLGITGGDRVSIKHVYRLIPDIEGAGTVSISIGGELAPGSGYLWSSPKTFTIGTSTWVDFKGVAGRSLAVRFESTSDNEWAINSYTLEGQISGTQ